MSSTPKVYDYINSLIEMLDESEKFKQCDFSILCDRYPIPSGKATYKAKVLYISLKNKDNAFKRLYYDKIVELGLEYITLTSNVRRRISTTSIEFFVEGSNEEQSFKEYKYYNYSIRKVNDKKTKELIEQMRQKYNINTPQLFVGVQQQIVLD